jgi:tetratricopeptide (TPR) repeat protein
LKRLTTPGPRIFVSYRRKDAGGHAGRLVAYLTQHYGRNSVFHDVQSIEGGEPFPAALERALNQSDVMLAVIGPDWLTATDAAGHRRLDDPDDWVRREIATALGQRRRVIPVLVGGVELPSASRLPEDLQGLTQLQYRAVRPDRFEDDVRYLVRSIGGRGRKVLGMPMFAWGAAAAMTIAAIGAVMWTRDMHTGPMRGDFNVAVARFTAVDAQGRTRVTDESLSLADTVYQRIDTELRALNEQGFDFEVRAPEMTGSISGEAKDKRGEAARKLAQDIQADVVIFGTLSEHAFAPEFFINQRKDHFRNAEELTGQFDLGTAIMGSELGAGSITNNMQLRKEMAERINALVQFVIGLSWYASQHFEQAQQAFNQALAIEGWKDADGREVLHLFVANTAGKLKDLETASRVFQHVIALNPQYARGLLGAAEVGYLQASGGCKPESVDAEGLRRAADRYRQALAAELKPAVSNVDAKAALGLGRVYACLSQALIDDRWREAEAAFRQVTDAYEAGNHAIRELAVEAYGGLGLSALPSEDSTRPGARFCEARQYYDAARRLSQDEQRASVFDRMLLYIDQRLAELGYSCE